MSVDLNFDGHVATILLNRPDKLNALTADMWRELMVCLDRCRHDDAIRAVVLTGAGRGFCAGADLSAAGSTDAPGPSLGGSVRCMRSPTPTETAPRGRRQMPRLLAFLDQARKVTLI